MGAPFDLLAFLTRSENRVTVLIALAREPASRRTLQDETGIARATLSRILADFGERDLAVREAHEYVATALGRHLATELRSLLASIETSQRLQVLGPWLPLSDLDLALGDFGDARVTLPAPVDPMGPVRRTAALLAESRQVRGLCDTVVPEVLRVLRRAVLEEGLQADVTVTEAAFEAVSTDPEVRGLVGDLLDTGRLDLRVFNGTIPLLAIDADGTVLLEVSDREGTIRGLVETGSDAITGWFDDAFASAQSAADPVTLDRLMP